jgi:hypothetical protein
MNELRKCGFIQPQRRMEFYSATKNNEIFLFENKWMEVEDFMISEVS